MAEDDADADTSVPEGGGKSKIFEGPAKKRREQILVVAAVAGVILTVLILRRKASASAATQGASATNASSGIDPNTGVPYSDEIATLAAQAGGGSGVSGGSYYGSGLSPQDTANLNAQFAGIGTELSQLQGQLTGLQSQVSVSSGTVTVPPTNQTPIANINPNAFPQTLGAGSQVDVLGQTGAPGSAYQGSNVSGNAPVYAYEGGKWQQGFNLGSLPQGTQLATLPQFQANVH